MNVSVVTILSVISMVVLCVEASVSDIKNGIIKNKSLILFFTIAVVLKLAYAFSLEALLWKPYVINVLLIIACSLVLFYSHSLAGGDCKLAMVLAMIYPMDCYVKYGDNKYTLFFAIGISLVYGYVYLVVSSIFKILKRKTKISTKNVINFIKSYLYNYICASIYISPVCYAVFALAKNEIVINVWVIRIVCILFAWYVGKSSILKKRVIIFSVFVFDILIGIVMKCIPIATDFGHYLFVGVMLLCQMSVRTNLYENINVNEVKEKMILSTVSSLAMQNSRVRGLPDVSSEDLRDRLTESQVNSIKRWADNNNIETICIVKKIPFAIFVSMGFVTYYILWSIVV